MKVYYETSIRDFDFWAGGRTNAERLTDAELARFERHIEETYPNGKV